MVLDDDPIIDSATFLPSLIVFRLIFFLFFMF